jgi:hypothetical protein
LAGGLLEETASALDVALGVPLATTLPSVGEQPKRPRAKTSAAAGTANLSSVALVVRTRAVIG